MKKFLFLIYFFCICCIPYVWAEGSLEDEVRAMKEQFDLMHKRMNQLEQKVAEQQQEIDGHKQIEEAYEGRIKDLEAQLAQEDVSSAGATGDRNPLSKWNPEIGVVGDIVAKFDSGKADTEGADRVSVRELELVFGSNVDPYSRFDATVSFSDFETASLEEAYLTHFGLPAGITGRLGKFKPKVGKAIPLHRDSLETVDEPLVVEKYFGVEGYNKAGIDFSKTLDLPSPLIHQVAIGILEGGNGEEGTIFGTARRTPTVYGHIKNYADLSDTTGLEFGFSDLIGSRDDDATGFEVHVLGFDTTITHQLNANQALKFQAEAFNVHRKQTLDADGNIWGSYGLVDLRLSPQWSTGFRYDYVELVDNATNPGKADQGLTGYLTLHQSEFARWRAQFTTQNLTSGKDNNILMLQGTFAIGEHKHKLQ